MELRHDITGKVIYSSPAATLTQTLEEYVYGGCVELGADLRGADLRGVNLINLRDIGVMIENINFQGCDLRGANFTNSSFVCCNFNDCNLQGAIFTDCTIHCCSFIGADFTNAVFNPKKQFLKPGYNAVEDAKGLSTAYRPGKIRVRLPCLDNKFITAFIPADAGRRIGINGLNWAEYMVVEEAPANGARLPLVYPRMQIDIAGERIKGVILSVKKPDDETEVIIRHPDGYSTDNRKPLGVFFTENNIVDVTDN
jgi:hypothetical protein